VALYVAIVRNGKFASISAIHSRDLVASGGNDPTFRLVEITRRPDIKVGDPWPPTLDPNDLCRDHPGHTAVVQAGKVIQVIAPAHIDTWKTEITSGVEAKLKQRLKHNPLADSSITLVPVPDGVAVAVGDPWPKGGA